jgi:hypothetical protein
MTFAESWTLGIEAHSRCKKCHFILPFNGPVTLAVCAKCGEKRKLDRAVWDEILDMPSKLSRLMRPGASKDCQVGIDADALRMKVIREQPRCSSCKREIDASRAPEQCPGCGSSLGKRPAPDVIKHTHRAAQYTLLGASDSDAPAQEAKRWYIWFHVDPEEVETDRKRARDAVRSVESKLPKLPKLEARPRQSDVASSEPFPSAPPDSFPLAESPYRGAPAPRWEPAPLAPADAETNRISRNLALVLIVIALVVGFFLGRLN